MAWGSSEPVVSDDVLGGEMSLGYYRAVVRDRLDLHEKNMEAAAARGDALAFNDEKEALEADRDRWQFANAVEKNPDTPLRWNAW